MTRVVLASASPGRLKVLRRAGIDPLVVVSGVDEDAVVGRLGAYATPAEVTSTLARAKAEKVAETIERDLAADCVVIGCDSMLYCRGELVGKPDSTDAARRQWESMSGWTGELYTGHCVIRLRDSAIPCLTTETAVATVYFGIPAAGELDAYIESGEPLQVAGGFTLDGLGGWFVEAVRGDPSAVIGTSLPMTRRLMQELGVSLIDVWNSNPLK